MNLYLQIEGFNLGREKRNQIIVELKQKMYFWSKIEIIITPKIGSAYIKHDGFKNDVGDEPRDDIFSA